MSERHIWKCDRCDCETEKTDFWWQITNWSGWAGSSTRTFDFCSWQCLLEWVEQAKADLAAPTQVAGGVGETKFQPKADPPQAVV